MIGGRCMKSGQPFDRHRPVDMKKTPMCEILLGLPLANMNLTRGNGLATLLALAFFLIQSIVDNL